MAVRALARRSAGTALALALLAPGTSVLAQGQPQPQPLVTATPSARAQANSAIVKPLIEIGRVRARTPYCAALARTQPAIDSAIAYEFTLQDVAADLRGVRMTSYVKKAQTLRRLELDLGKLWDEAKEGRGAVVALRAEANAPGVDPQRRREMLDFANALHGAKTRQMMLAKQIARVYGIQAEAKVEGIGDDDPVMHGKDPAAGPSSFGLDAQIANPELIQGLFGVSIAEEPIRDDLKRAAEHGLKAVELANCGDF